MKTGYMKYLINEFNEEVKQVEDEYQEDIKRVKSKIFMPWKITSHFFIYFILCIGLIVLGWILAVNETAIGFLMIPLGIWGIYKISIENTFKCFKLYEEAKNTNMDTATKKFENNKKKFMIRSMELYDYYVENKYDIKDEKTNKVVAKSKDIPIEYLNDFYEYGKELRSEKNEKENTQQWAEECTKNESEKNFTFILNKDKYLYEINQLVTEANKVISQSKASALNLQKEELRLRNTKPDDPYFLAGMANGIAGPAAAIATANDINRSNIAKQKATSELADVYRDIAGKGYMKAIKAEHKVERLEEVSKKVEAALVDDTTDLKDKIKFKVVDKQVSNSKNIVVKVECKVDEVEVLEKKAFIDGSISITVFNKEGKELATGYYNAPNIAFDEEGRASTYNPIGFTDGDFEVICINQDKETITEKDLGKIEIKIEHLWATEEFLRKRV